MLLPSIYIHRPLILFHDVLPHISDYSASFIFVNFSTLPNLISYDRRNEPYKTHIFILKKVIKTN